MFLENDAVSGFAKIISAYEQYVATAEKQNKKPLSILAYMVEMFQ